MKKFIFTLLVSTGFCFSISAQSTGDYRSVANGNWNDLTKWETYNGSSWVSSITYPGQNPGTGKVIITAETEIKITGTVPYPAGLLIIDGFYYYDDNFNEIYTYGTLRFAAENTAALIISGDIIIDGRLAIENQNGAKTHNLSVGGSFVVGGDFSSISQDDRLAVTFNTTVPNSEINSTGLILFQDVIFDGMGISYETYVGIAGTATFIKGIVKHGAQGSPVIFYDDATASGSSGISFIDGGVNKIGDDPFTFPIGREEVYAPITMSAPVGQIETFNALYMRRSGAAIGAIADPGLYSISDCEYWFLSNLNGQSLDYPLNVTVGWTSAGACGLPADYIPDVSEVTLAHFNGNDWDNHGGIGAGTSTNGSVTWSGVTNSGVFSLGNVGTSCETPSGLAAFNITANSAMLSWDAVAGAVSYDVDYKVYNMWVRAATEITSTLFFLSGLSPLVGYDWRVQARCNLATSSARQATFMTTAIVACNDAYEPNNTSTQARAFNPGNAISASLSSASDIDWFKLTTPNSSNTSLEVTLRNLPADYD
ncbi:MAG TPA: fibronectin type III domain-containing protein, partial [Chitinophagaceae bacterium]|nr:fibronectin type III domain-containing protein [Chitinophagaceae bacterium]